MVEMSDPVSRTFVSATLVPAHLPPRPGPALPWVIAAAAAIAAHRWLDPHYTLLIGVGAGAAAGMILPEKRHD